MRLVSAVCSRVILVIAATLLCSRDGAVFAQGNNVLTKVMLCGRGTTQYSPKMDNQGCSDGLGIRRKLLLPHNVYSDNAHYESWGLVLHIFLADEGLRFLPRPPDLAPYAEHTDTVTLSPGDTPSFEERLKSSASVFAGNRFEQFAWDDESDPDFRIFTLPSNLTRNGDDHPARLYLPKTGDKIFFVCATPSLLLSDGSRNDPRCSAEDFTDPSDDRLHYSLRRMKLKEWRRYSKWLWDYVNAASARDG